MVYSVLIKKSGNFTEDPKKKRVQGMPNKVLQTIFSEFIEDSNFVCKAAT